MILLKAFRGTQDGDQLMKEFKVLASQLFKPHPNLIYRAAHAVLGTLRTIFTDGWLDSGYFDLLLQEALPKGKLFGSPGGQDLTKVGVTTTRSDSTPCVLGSYNRLRKHVTEGEESSK